MVNSWDRVSLGDICRVEAGAGFPIVYQGLKDQEFPFFKVGDMNTAGNEKEMHVFQHSISEEIRKKLRATAFPKGTIVFPKIGAAIATNKKRMLVKPSCVDNNVMALLPSENLDSSFLFYLLLNKDLSDFANTGNPPSIRQSNVEEWAIPLPPLTEQKRIASLLKRADRLRQLRRTAGELGESLLQSVFLEMFGEPETNSKGWDKLPFDDVCAIDAEMIDPRDEKYLDLPHIGGANIESVTGNLFDLKSAREEGLISGKFLVHPNDILFSKIRPKLRKVAFPQIHAVCSADIYPISIRSESCNVYYLLHYLRSDSFSKKVSELAETRTNIPKVNREELSEQFIPVPPLSLQEEFGGVVKRVESLRGRMSEAGRQVEGLFESLLAQSFDGGR